MDRLTNPIRPYPWGSTTAIPHLLGVEPTGEPQAEMWMGAHPGAPSRTTRGPLNEVIAAAPMRELGPRATATFGPRLPFLLKVLAAAAPLSLQVHPDRAQAQQGFDDEERRGIPVDAPHRNYKDANHKPELICALTPFDGLCGFREPTATADLLAGLEVDSLKPYVDLLHAHPADAALREVLTGLLTADPEKMAVTVAQAAAACRRLSDTTGPASGPCGAWSVEYAAYAALAQHYPGDPGVIAAMLLNHVRLQPGEAMYLGAGVPHAYLEGLGIEIMANSDNVLRCGLTPKHIDVPELLRIVRFEPGGPNVLRPQTRVDGEEVYETPIDEFRLSRYVLSGDGRTCEVTAATPQILLCTVGTIRVGEISLVPGESLFVPADEMAEIGGEGAVFRATVVV